MSSRLLHLGVIAIVGMVSTGCGGDGESSAPAPGADAPADVHVVAEDISFGQGAYDVTAGRVEILLDNNGSIRHTLGVEGIDDFKLAVTSRGDTDRGTVDLEPGEYTIFCDVPGHRQAGMESTFTVS